ncbi:MAG: hypothetical protein HOL38_07590 [Verrucomicrobia bacterium]|jgi:hypothetical protein|nr:hypothetical protein [Verrucomicrobiota bacterium]
MKTLLTLCAAVGVLLAASNSASAYHNSPEDLAARCVNAVDGVVDRCTNAAADETQECVRTIRRLLSNGEVRAAHRVARECIRSATTRTENCANRVDRICLACIDILLEMGEPQLARRVNGVCEDAISQLRSLLQREKNAIRTALSGG